RLPHDAGPIAGVVGGIGDEGERLIAVEGRVGVDQRQINLVLALREVDNLVELVDTVDEDVLRFLDGGVLEDIIALVAHEVIATDSAYQRIVSGAAYDPVVATLSIENI